MKSRILAGIWLASLVLLSGCKGFWDAPASSGTGGTTPTTLSSGVFYVLNQTTKQIAGFVISSGTLGKITGSPYALPATPNAIAVAPGAGFLYVGTVNGIYLYTIGSGGALTLGNSGNPISTDIPSAMLVSGSWLVDVFTNAGSSVQLDAIPINSIDGCIYGHRRRAS